MKKTYVRILTAVIQIDEDGNEVVEPACMDIPVTAATAQEAMRKVSAAIQEVMFKQARPVPSQQESAKKLIVPKKYYWELDPALEQRWKQLIGIPSKNKLLP